MGIWGSMLIAIHLETCLEKGWTDQSYLKKQGVLQKLAYFLANSGWDFNILHAPSNTLTLTVSKKVPKIN